MSRHSNGAGAAGTQQVPRRGFGRAIVSGLGTVILICLAALAIVVAVVPFATHGKALAVLSGSMVPTFDPGDMIIVRGYTEGDEVRVGQVITYMPNPDDPTLITHRVVGTGTEPDGGSYYIARGDANGADDDPVYSKQIRGIYLFRLPKIGYLSNWIGGETRTAVLFIGIGLLGYAAYQLIFAGRWNRGRRPAPGGNQGEGTGRAPGSGEDAHGR
jgi:signal peptidase